MKVLQVLNHFLPGNAAGTEIYTWALSKHLKQRGVEVSIIIPNYNQTTSNVYQYDELNVYQFAEPTIVDRELIMGLKEPVGLTEFKNYLKTDKPDIIHFHEFAGSNGIGLWHIRVAKKLGFKIVVTFHLAGYSCKTSNLMFKDAEQCDGIIKIDKCTDCYLHSKKIAPFKKSIILSLAKASYFFGYNSTRFSNSLGTAIGSCFLIQGVKHKLFEIVNLSDKTVVLTKWYRKVLLSNGVDQSKLYCIEQGLPFISAHHESDISVNNSVPLKLVFVGRISSIKGIDILLDAILKIPNELLTIDIFGDALENSFLETCIQRSKEHKNIHWKGRVAPEKVLETLYKYNLLVLPSSVCEMAPLVIQEAFAAGIPVLASNVYGNAEQIRHGVNGWLFEFKNSESLYKQLTELIHHPELIEGTKKNIFAPRLFSEIAEDYMKVYNEVISI